MNERILITISHRNARDAVIFKWKQIFKLYLHVKIDIAPARCQLSERWLEDADKKILCKNIHTNNFLLYRCNDDQINIY